MLVNMNVVYLTPGPSGHVDELDIGDGVLVPLLAFLQYYFEVSEGALVV